MSRSDIDIHLLKCLEVLVSERHVTRAADKMKMSQSGMSTALARLRRIFGDQILVRTSRGMMLSERAPEIAGAARRALHEIDKAIEGQIAFDLATAKDEFRIMASDYVGRMLLPQLMRICRDTAPGISLTVMAPQPSRLREALANSDVDLVVGFFHEISEGLFQTGVIEEPLVCIVRNGHPRIKTRVSLADYGREDHVFFGSPPIFISSIEIVIERLLNPLGIRRSIRANLPSFAMVPQIVEQTDMIATLPERLAYSFADQYALRVLPLPFETGMLKVSAIWHERMNANSAHKFLRQTFQNIGKSIQKEPLPKSGPWQTRSKSVSAMHKA